MDPINLYESEEPVVEPEPVDEENDIFQYTPLSTQLRIEDGLIIYIETEDGPIPEPRPGNH